MGVPDGIQQAIHLRKNVIEKRHAWQKASQNTPDCFHRYLDAHAGLRTELVTLLETSSDPAVLVAVQKLEDILHAVTQLNKNIGQLCGLNPEIVQMETEILQIDRDLVLISTDEYRAEAIKPLSTGQRPKSSYQDSEELPRLVEEYFDRIGDIGWMNEALVDIHFEHDKAREERDRLRDQDQILVPLLDNDFELDYTQRRKTIERQLVESHEQAARLRVACEEEGLSTDPYHWTRHDCEDHVTIHAWLADVHSTEAPSEKSSLKSSPSDLYKPPEISGENCIVTGSTSGRHHLTIPENSREIKDRGSERSQGASSSRSPRRGSASQRHFSDHEHRKSFSPPVQPMRHDEVQAAF